MRLDLLYFAGLRELVGADTEQVDLPEGLTVASLRERLVGVHPALAGRLGGVRFAVDEVFVDEDAVVHPGARVALIPPVSGG
jgi:molybdopterin converting factor subunit 1